NQRGAHAVAVRSVLRARSRGDEVDPGVRVAAWLERARVRSRPRGRPHHRRPRRRRRDRGRSPCRSAAVQAELAGYTGEVTTPVCPVSRDRNLPIGRSTRCHDAAPTIRLAASGLRTAPIPVRGIAIPTYPPRAATAATINGW